MLVVLLLMRQWFDVDSCMLLLVWYAALGSLIWIVYHLLMQKIYRDHLALPCHLLLHHHYQVSNHSDHHNEVMIDVQISSILCCNEMIEMPSNDDCITQLLQLYCICCRLLSTYLDDKWLLPPLYEIVLRTFRIAIHFLFI